MVPVAPRDCAVKDSEAVVRHLGKMCVGWMAVSVTGKGRGKGETDILCVCQLSVTVTKYLT